MPLQPHQQRVIAERSEVYAWIRDLVRLRAENAASELPGRVERLSQFLGTDTFRDLAPEEREALREQGRVMDEVRARLPALEGLGRLMAQYLKTLDRRIERF